MTDFSTTASWAALERKDLTGFLALNGYQMFVSSSLPPTDRPSGKTGGVEGSGGAETPSSTRLSLRDSYPDARAVASGSGATEVEDRAPAIASPSVAPASADTPWCVYIDGERVSRTEIDS